MSTSVPHLSRPCSTHYASSVSLVDKLRSANVQLSKTRVYRCRFPGWPRRRGSCALIAPSVALEVRDHSGKSKAQIRRRMAFAPLRQDPRNQPTDIGALLIPHHLELVFFVRRQTLPRLFHIFYSGRTRKLATRSSSSYSSSSRPHLRRLKPLGGVLGYPRPAHRQQYKG